MLSDLVRAAIGRWQIIMLCALASMAGGFWAARTLPPRYVGKASVLMELVKPDPETGEIVPGKMLEDYVGTQMRLAASAATTRHIISQFGWLDDPALQAEYASTGGSAEGMEDWLATRLAAAVGVSVPDETNLLELSFTAPDPDNAKVLAEALRTAFLTGVIERKRRNAQREEAWLGQQASVALRRYLMVLEERNSYAASKRIPLGINPSAERKLAEALFQRGSLPDAPTRPPAARDVSAAVSGDPAAPDDMRAAIRQSRGRMAAAPPVGSGDSHLQTLQQRTELARQSYLAVIARRKQAWQDTMTGESNMSAFGEATVADTPAFPRYPRIVGGSLVLGLILGIECALLFEFIRRRVRAPSDLEDAAGKEVLAVISAGSRLRCFRRAAWRTWLEALVRGSSFRVGSSHQSHRIVP